MTEPTQEQHEARETMRGLVQDWGEVAYARGREIEALQAENAALRSDIERLRAFATGFCSRHAVPDATCDICNPVVHALRAEVERLRADNLSSLLRGRKLEREWWLERVGTCENGGDIADLMEAATLQIEQLPDPTSWEANDA